MSDLIVTPQLIAPLRQQAEQQLRTGNAQLSTTFTASADALGVLYRLSSVANTAGDGLKLLHELQIHQVELDLQLEQLQDNEREISHELGCYRQFFEMAPMGCLILSPDGIITDCNTAATRLFQHVAAPQNGCQPAHLSEQLCGRSLLSLISATCRPLCSAALARVQRNQQSTTLLVIPVASAVSVSGTAGVGHLRLTISLSPDHQAILITIAGNTANLPAQQPEAEL